MTRPYPAVSSNSDFPFPLVHAIHLSDENIQRDPLGNEIIIPDHSTMTVGTEPFWKTKALTGMTQEEWESLCDGCARCCLHKVEYKDTGEVRYTNVACRLLDVWSCRCTSYVERIKLVPMCLLMTPAKAADLEWLPRTCAYRRLALGKELEWWHPLVSGSPETVHQAGVSVRGKVLPEQYVNLDDLEKHIIRF